VDGLKRTSTCTGGEIDNCLCALYPKNRKVNSCTLKKNKSCPGHNFEDHPEITLDNWTQCMKKCKGTSWCKCITMSESIGCRLERGVFDVGSSSISSGYWALNMADCVDYVEHTGGVSSCPKGYDHVLDEQECKDYAKREGLPWGRVDCWVSTVGFFGCYRNDAQVYFSTCVGSSTLSYHQAICRQVPGTTHRMVNAKKVCHSDNCVGTLTNPIPNGEHWMRVGQASSSGCCRFSKKACDTCIPPKDFNADYVAPSSELESEVEVATLKHTNKVLQEALQALGE